MANDPPSPQQGLPRLLRMRPAVVVSNVTVVVAVAMLAVVLVDVYAVPVRPEWPLWTGLFNDRFIEWLQWFLLAATAITAGFVAGCLHQANSDRVAAFLWLLTLGTGLLLIEDAGDVRHTLIPMLDLLTPERAMGVTTSTLLTLAYFALLASPMILALIRHFPDVWSFSAARAYLLTGYGAYALAAGGQAVGGFFDFQRRLGRWLHEELPGSQLSVPDGYPPAIWHEWFVDAVLEESLEAIAAACLLALVLTLARERIVARQDRLPETRS